MSKEQNYNITEEDLAVFPPHLSSFLAATLLLMVSHGLAATIVFFFYFALHPATGLALVVGSSMIFVFFNILLIRGHLVAIKALKLLAVIYCGVAVSSFAEIAHTPIDTRLSLAVLIPSVSAWLVLRSRRYQTMAQFIAKRWRFYRETGRTVIEELNRQKMQRK